MTKASVFIIESLDLDDEECENFEGKFLAQILHLSDKQSKYYYVRTKKELGTVLKIFWKSDYRYLHLSCHGNKESISTTLDNIPFWKFRVLAESYLRDRRLFVSACSAVNNNLAKILIPSSKCYSIIGPARRVPFGDAAITWASFYHLVFQEDAMRMKRDAILSALTSVFKTFGVKMNYFRINEKLKEGYEKIPVPLDPRT